MTTREFTLPEAHGMTNYVRKILADIEAVRQERQQSDRKVNLLHDVRMSRNYRVRQVYYDAIREQERHEQKLAELSQELEGLGVQILDEEPATVGFPFLWAPTRTSKTAYQAYFLLKLNDDPNNDLRVWRFHNDKRERRAPRHWLAELDKATNASDTSA